MEDKQPKTITNKLQSTLEFPCSTLMHAHDFRKAISNWLIQHPQGLAQIPSVALLFQRDSQGLRINESACLRFDASLHTQYIHAIGQQACELLGQINTFCQQFSATRPKFLGTPVLTEHALFIDNTASSRYTAAKLIVCKNAEQYTLWQQCDEQAKHERISNVILSGLSKQQAALGLPQLDDLQITDIQLMHEWPEAKLQSIQSKAYVRVVNVKFTLNATLHGNWAAGPLGNKGYGQLESAQ